MLVITIWHSGIRSEDGGLLGFVYVEIDAPAFATDWVAVAQPAAIGALLAAALLVPAGWLLGERMGRPIAHIASCIARIGRTDAAQLSAQLPVAKDPELNRIGEARLATSCCDRAAARASASRSVRGSSGTPAQARRLKAAAMAAAAHRRAEIKLDMSSPDNEEQAAGALEVPQATLRRSGMSNAKAAVLHG